VSAELVKLRAKAEAEKKILRQELKEAIKEG